MNIKEKKVELIELFPDNNIVFSWEYEQSQAMLQLVETGIFQD